MKLMNVPAAAAGMARYGYSESQLFPLGILELCCAVVYAIPRTSALGAILLTGYMGGATAANVRIGDSSYGMTVLIGVLAWVGLYLRDSRLGELLPLRS
jgi:hypothetical protein